MRIREDNLGQDSAFDIEIYGTDYSGVRIGMAGRHQIENAKTALICLWRFCGKKGIIKVSRDKLYQGLLCARQPGRFEVAGRATLVSDSRRRPQRRRGRQALKETVKALFSSATGSSMVTGMLADKEIGSNYRCSSVEITDQFVVTEPDNPRKMPVQRTCRQLLDEKGAVVQSSIECKRQHTVWQQKRTNLIRKWF